MYDSHIIDLAAFDSSKVLFSSNKQGTMDIYTCDILSGNIIPLIVSPDVNREPTPSPDKKSIAYIKQSHGTTTIQIYSIKKKSEKTLKPFNGKYLDLAW